MTLVTPVLEHGRIKIVVTADAAADAVTVTARHPSGRQRIVRGIDKALLSGGSFIGWDHEAPIGVQMEYTATIWADPSVRLNDSAPFVATWDTEADWLKDPLEPARNVQVSIEDIGEFTYETPTGFHTVMRRPDPIAIGEVRRAATGEIKLLTETTTDSDRIHYLTASGNVLLLQSSQESGIGNMYLALRGVKETKLSKLKTDTRRRFTIGYQEVASPAGDPGGFLTWADAAAQYATWQSIVDAGFTSWLDFIERLQSADAAPILTWRGA